MFILLLTLLAATALAIVRLRDLFATVMLTGIYSFIGAGWMFLLDAPDVAFTEAAVGAGLSTVLMLGALALTSDREKETSRSPWLPLTLVTLTGALLVYGTLDMPHYGVADAPAHLHLAPTYFEETARAIDIPNVVTAVLVSFRGYDTLGETAVIFTAAVAVVLLLAGRGNRPAGRS